MFKNSRNVFMATNEISVAVGWENGAILINPGWEELGHLNEHWRVKGFKHAGLLRFSRYIKFSILFVEHMPRHRNFSIEWMPPLIEGFLKPCQSPQHLTENCNFHLDKWQGISIVSSFSFHLSFSAAIWIVFSETIHAYDTLNGQMYFQLGRSSNDL